MKLKCFSSMVYWRLLNRFNTQVSGIQFNWCLSLLLSGVKPWTHVTHFAMKDHHWLLWGQDFTYILPPWKAKIKNPTTLFSLKVYVSRLYGHFILSLPDGMSLRGYFCCSNPYLAFLTLSFCVIVLNCKRQRVKEARKSIFQKHLWFWNTR